MYPSVKPFECAHQSVHSFTSSRFVTGNIKSYAAIHTWMTILASRWYFLCCENAETSFLSWTIAEQSMCKYVST